MTGRPAQVCVRITIRGRVQGVFFRATLKDCADSEGVSGWVRNAADGSVEALLQGAKPRVDAVIAWARSGPPGAQVDSIEVEPAEPPRAGAAGFQIR